MHIRLASPADDFHLLSPLDPLAELGDYTWSHGFIHFLFCKTCGVRCFSFAGEGEVEEVEGPDGEKRKVWHPKRGSKEGRGQGNMYLSVNAHAIDADQEGFDMREWTEQKLLWYLDTLHHDTDMAAPSVERPQPGGCY
jgi:hypothetical protein